MQNVVRSRVRELPGLRATAPPPARSLIDAEAVTVLHRAARALLDDLPALTDCLVATLREREPAYRAAIDADATEVWREVRRSLGHSVGSLIHPRESREDARRCSWRIGAQRAEQGLPLDALLHAFRLGGALVWESLVGETARRHPEDIRLLVHVATDVWNFVDEHCTLAADAYRQAERHLTRHRDNRQRVMTEALLEGTTRVADLPEVAATLDLPEGGRYAVVLITGTGSRARSAAGAGAGAGSGPTSGGAAGHRPPGGPTGMRVLWHAATGGRAEYGIVLIGDGRLTDLSRGLSAGTGARIGISSAVEGLAAVGDARRLAETALRSCPEDGGTVLLDEQLPAALVVSSPALGAALAERALGPLLRLAPADRDVLLDTLTVWLDCDGSAPRAGSRLYCHRNTVLNRLRRYEQLTGRSLARPSDVVELSLALSARRLLRT